MKYKNIRGLMAVLLLAASITGCAVTVPEKNIVKESQTKDSTKAGKKATTGEIADYFIQASSKYAQTADRSVILKGINESEQTTQLQMLVIASRTFGELPAPVGNAARIAAPAPDLNKVPEWAKEEMENLSREGILAASDLFQTSGAGEENIMDQPVTLKDAQKIAARFYAVLGTNPKDDFYTAVNQQQLSSLEIPEGSETAGGSASVTANTERQLKELILEIVNGTEEYAKGSPEQKIRDLYNNYENTGARNREGIEPLKKYLHAVDQAGSFSELYKTIAQSVNELGNFANGLIPGIPVTDTKDSTRKVLQLMTQVPGLPKEDYEKTDGAEYKEYRELIIEELIAVGESQKNAETYADDILKIEKILVENIEEQDESGEIKEQKYYTMKTLDKMMPQAKISELLKGIGLNPDVKMIVFDDKQFAAYTKLFTEENLETFKAMEKIALLTGYSSYLSQDLAEKFGTSGILSADIAIQNFLSEELGQIYVNRYFPAESKEEIEKMVKMQVDTFKERINRLEWMEESTKKEAVKKLDALTVLIGYPDEWEMNHAEIRGAAEGGSYFENVASSETAKWNRYLEELEKPVDPGSFPLAAYTVNASASRNTNTLIFPAGILQAPFYDKDASFETNLGAIGSTIAHEITHIFDDGGAQFDAEGNKKDWWAEKDYKHFKGLCQKTIDFYDGHEAAPGIAANGKGTLSENIADIGGIACGLEILSKMENPDYDAFFKSYTNQWVRVADYDTLTERAQTDEHAPNNLRCNLVLSNFQKFYDTYGIKKGDGMYVAPEDRITIW